MDTNLIMCATGPSIDAIVIHMIDISLEEKKWPDLIAQYFDLVATEPERVLIWLSSLDHNARPTKFYIYNQFFTKVMDIERRYKENKQMDTCSTDSRIRNLLFAAHLGGMLRRYSLQNRLHQTAFMVGKDMLQIYNTLDQLIEEHSLDLLRLYSFKDKRDILILELKSELLNGVTARVIHVTQVVNDASFTLPAVNYEFADSHQVLLEPTSQKAIMPFSKFVMDGMTDEQGVD